MEVWEFCQEIASKSEWYRKVFDPVIVAKWRAEAGDNANFELALSLIQSSAKGTKILKNCDWENGSLCQDCVDECKEHLMHCPDDIYFDDDSSYDDELVGQERIDKFFANEHWRDSECVYNIVQESHCHHIKCKCEGPVDELSDYICYHPDGVLSTDLHIQLKDMIKEMSEIEPVDYHPGSNEQVRDLIHPSLYCYVKGKSVHNDWKIRGKYEDSLNNYRWLPSEFIITEGKVKVASYINNLDEQKYPGFIPLIEQVFGQYIPDLENVMQKKLNNRTVQVIVKVGSMILDSTKPKYNGGEFHLEGIPEEYIAATCIHYVTTDNMTESYLEFRKPTIICEEALDYPQNDSGFTIHHYGITDHYEGEMNKYLGLIKCSPAADVIFPNNLQHRVKEFSLSGETEALRTIICFFVVDPDHKIISTADIPKQQNVISIEDSRKYRERLMFHRKYYVNQFNEEIFLRSINLCEH